MIRHYAIMGHMHLEECTPWINDDRLAVVVGDDPRALDEAVRITKMYKDGGYSAFILDVDNNIEITVAS